MAEVQIEKSANDSNSIKPTTFDRLLRIIHGSLHESQKSIDTRSAVEKCYGEDTSIFGEKTSAIDILANLINGSIENVNEDMKEEIEDIMRKEMVDLKLQVLDAITEEQRNQDWTKKEAEDEDRQSAQDALTISKLPNGITTKNFLEFQAYAMKSKARDEILAEIGKYEKDNQALQKKVEEERQKISERIKSIDNDVDILDNTANTCSFHGIS